MQLFVLASVWLENCYFLRVYQTHCLENLQGSQSLKKQQMCIISSPEGQGQGHRLFYFALKYDIFTHNR